MGSRDQKSSSTTNYTGSWQAPPTTPELQRLEAWQPDQTLLNSGIAADFSNAEQSLQESTGGYNGATFNPNERAMMLKTGMADISQQRANALSDANRQRNLIQLGQYDTAARLAAPQYITTGAQTQNVQQAPSLLGSIITGGLGVAAAF